MRAAARVVAVVGALFWGVAWFGLIDLLTVFVEGEEFAEDYLLESGWGLVFLVLVTVPLLGLAVRPGTAVWVWTPLTTAAALALGALVAGSPRHLLLALGVAATAALAGWLGRVRWHVLRAMDQPAAVLAGISFFPAIGYAVDMAGQGQGEVTNGFGHYPVQAGLGLAVAFACTLLALTHGLPGRLLVRVVTAVPAVWIGVESVVWPDRNGSVGTMWGIFTVAWGIILLVAFLVPEREGRGG